MSESEFKIKGISDISGGYFAEDGIDIPTALHYYLEKGSLEGFSGGKHVSNEELLAAECDLLIPAALGNVITMSNVDDIKAKYIVEGANGPIDSEADAKLFERGVVVLPDILANAGGVTVSYFEWVQNRQYYHWSLDRVRQELDAILSTAFEDVWQLSQTNQVSLRTAAFMVAIDRVWRSAQLAGF